MKVANAEQMRALDRAAIETFHIPGIVLMENAALGVVSHMETRYGSLRDRSVLVICGKGNNGGDGFAVARHLSNRGSRVQIILLAKRNVLKGDAAINCRICEKMNIPFISILHVKNLARLSTYTRKADLIVDAILGTGITPPVRGMVEQVVIRLNRLKKPIVSVDLPSGMSADSSEVTGNVVKADLTVTFGLPKLSLVQYPSLDYAGDVQVTDISLPAELVNEAHIPVEMIDQKILQALPPRKGNLHKGKAGRVLLVCGSKEMPGAAVMAGISCFRIGAGLVYAAVPESVRTFFHKKLMEGVLVPLSKNNNEHLTLSALPDILRAAKGKKVAAVGPGIGLDPDTGEMIRSLVQKIRIPVVLDADGITHLSEDPEVLKKTKAQVIITPHPGEMARLTGISGHELNTHRVDVARNVAGEYGIIVVLKGARTVIADPTGRAWINSTGNPGMATAGTGDVLTGMIAGLVAQGMKPLDAARAAVYLHGRCGDLAAHRFSNRGLLSRDLIREIPNALKERSI